jgi:hypothetical protein
MAKSEAPKEQEAKKVKPDKAQEKKVKSKETKGTEEMSTQKKMFNKKLGIIVLSLLVVILLGVLFYLLDSQGRIDLPFVGTDQEESAGEDNEEEDIDLEEDTEGDQADTEEEEDSTDLEDESEEDVEEDELNVEGINWLTYSNSDYPDLSFEYPEGSTISLETESGGVCTPEECFTITVEWEDIVVEVNQITGIGGMASYAGSKFRILYEGDVDGWYMSGDYEGVSAIHVHEGGEFKIRYWLLLEGDIGPVQARTMMITLPEDEFEDYKDIVDKIGTSIYGVEPMEEEKWCVAYYDYDNEILYGVNEDGTIFEILSEFTQPNESYSNMRVNEARDKVAITSVIGNGPEFRLQFYDLEDQATILGTDFETTGMYAQKWIDNTTLVDYSGSDYRMYDLDTETMSVITQVEYDGYVD